MVHLKYPIVSYKEELQGSTPRTGYVQIDFNLGDADWERFYHFSPGDKSEYKGAHRNLAIAAISSVNVIMESMGTDSQGRPRSTYRWKFGSNGFIKVHRVSVKDPRSGDWMKKQVDHDLGQTLRDPTLIAHTLFLTEDATADDLFSLETIMAAVKRYGGMVEQEQIWRRMAHNFTDWKDGKNFTYPPEIAKYIPLDDK